MQWALNESHGKGEPMTDTAEEDPGGLSDLAGARKHSPEGKAGPRICSAQGPWIPSSRIHKRLRKQRLDFKAPTSGRTMGVASV